MLIGAAVIGIMVMMLVVLMDRRTVRLAAWQLRSGGESYELTITTVGLRFSPAVELRKESGALAKVAWRDHTGRSIGPKRLRADDAPSFLYASLGRDRLSLRLPSGGGDGMPALFINEHRARLEDDRLAGRLFAMPRLTWPLVGAVLSLGR